MKTTKRIILACAACVLIILSFNVRKQIKPNPFIGTWQQSSFTTGGRNSVSEVQAFLKVFREDGSFQGYLISPRRSVQTMGGSYKIINDSTYTETIATALYKPVVGKTHTIIYKMAGDSALMKGQYDSADEKAGSKIKYEEGWKKLTFPK